MSRRGCRCSGLVPEYCRECAPQRFPPRLDFWTRLMLRIAPHWFERRVRAVASMDPQKLTPQAVRDMLGIPLPQWYCRLVLWMGEREGYFARNEDGTYRKLPHDR